MVFSKNSKRKIKIAGRICLLREKKSVKAPVLSYKLPGATCKSVFQVFPGKSSEFHLKNFSRHLQQTSPGIRGKNLTAKYLE